MLERRVSSLSGMGAINLLYNNAKEANFRRSTDTHKPATANSLGIPKLEEEIDFKNMTLVSPEHYMDELSKIVLILKDFEVIKEMLFNKDLLVVTAQNAYPSALYSNFIRGIKRYDNHYRRFIFARPSGLKIVPCYESLNCTVKDCEIRHLDAAQVCFRLNELDICAGNCHECKFMEIRYTQIMEAIDATRDILPTIDQRKGMCGKNMCREGKIKGCPNGCTNN
ncbi:MAG: hypothetical protein HQK91_06090 [Nitrospirae bacterium]|nr:hypothetical protein [Nitrospirota bacterium]